MEKLIGILMLLVNIHSTAHQHEEQVLLQHLGGLNGEPEQHFRMGHGIGQHAMHGPGMLLQRTTGHADMRLRQGDIRFLCALMRG